MASTQDLSAVGDTAEFVQALRLLKIWAGNPSFDQLARRSGVPRSTLADVVKRRRRQLPALEVVRAFVQACGLPDTSAWDDAWRRLQASTLAPPERVVPRELPPNVVGFAGRDDVVKTLDTILHAPAPRLITICGTAGVGKTALAIHWAHRHADQFPDGQLYVNLRGYDPGQPPCARRRDYPARRARPREPVPQPHCRSAAAGPARQRLVARARATATVRRGRMSGDRHQPGRDVWVGSPRRGTPRSVECVLADRVSAPTQDARR